MHLSATPQYPHGQGLEAITSMNEEGYSSFDLSLEIVTFLSSTGPRKASLTLRGICAASSRNSTPLCARLISPGMMPSPHPPPIIAGSDAE